MYAGFLADLCIKQATLGLDERRRRIVAHPRQHSGRVLRAEGRAVKPILLPGRLHGFFGQDHIVEVV
ncbi:hypothetical protein D3C75_1326800 [compost metagenome]